MALRSSELIVNRDGSIFHLTLFPEEIADDILLVGDPGRVDLIGSFLDQVEVEKHNREFKTITGYVGNKRLSIISSGIGTDNIDIVINELDALKNFDLEQKVPRDNPRSLRLIRLGTSGALQEDIPSGSYVMTVKSVGFDNLMHFYNIPTSPENREIEQKLKQQFGWPGSTKYPYVFDASAGLTEKLDNPRFIKGMTISAPGFYGPQGRKLRIPLSDDQLNNKIYNFRFGNLRITNYEMESSAIYGLAGYLGHETLTLCAIIANRVRGDHIADYRSQIEDLVALVLEKL